jgi:hypothetical protein
VIVDPDNARYYDMGALACGESFELRGILDGDRT